MKPQKYTILLVLFLISLISSVMLVIYDFKPLPQICTPSEGCYTVKNSQYNSPFFGIPNEYLGAGFFLAMFLLTLSQIAKPTVKKHNFIFGGIIIASLFALYSIYIQVFMLSAYCKYCLTMDISSLIALAFVAIFRK